MTPSQPPSGEFSYDVLLNWSLLIGISLWAGWASFIRKMRDGHVRAWNITEFVGELAISGFTGIITAHLCDYIGAPHSLKYALVGIMAHMGSRALFQFENLANRKLGVDKGPKDETK